MMAFYSDIFTTGAAVGQMDVLGQGSWKMPWQRLRSRTRRELMMETVADPPEVLIELRWPIRAKHNTTADHAVIAITA